MVPFLLGESKGNKTITLNSWMEDTQSCYLLAQNCLVSFKNENVKKKKIVKQTKNKEQSKMVFDEYCQNSKTVNKVNNLK